MAITKPPVLPIWADTGDKTQPTNAEIAAGWIFTNVPPSRSRFNWILNFCANAVRYFSRRGLSDWDAAETYLIDDRIIGNDGKTYRSKINANMGFTPSTSPLQWELWGLNVSDLAGIIVKQTYTQFTTTGTAPAYILTPNPALTSYLAGARFSVAFHANGTGINTVNINNLGALNLVSMNGAGTYGPANIKTNMRSDIVLDGAGNAIVIDPIIDAPIPLNPPPPASTTVSGVVELADNTETIAGVDATRAVTPAGLSASLVNQFGIVALGYGQSWQAVTRLVGVTYTNTTGQPILFNLGGDLSANDAFIIMTVGGIPIAYSTAGDLNTKTALSGIFIPAGATYSWSMSAGVLNNPAAVELR